MGKRIRRPLTRRISGQAPVRIPGPALVPFLLFWCLGSFALGQELARLPLTALAAAAIHPFQSALQAQGALAHAATTPSNARTRQVATGLLGGKPPAAPARKTSGKTGHTKTKLSSHGHWVAMRHGTAVAGARASRGQEFMADMDGAAGYWASYASWSEQRGWTVVVGWNARLASDGSARWVDLTHAADGCSP